MTGFLLQATGISVSTYFGNFPITFLCMSSALAGGFYNWTLLGSKFTPAINEPQQKAANTITLTALTG